VIALRPQEDITLTTTTLRYATTNELASLNNASIANSRVVNYKRSSKAMVSIRVQFDIDVTKQQLDDFRYALEAYLENRPREWIGLIHYRADTIDNNAGILTFLYRAQHVKSWQELAAIMISKGEWERHAVKVATEMDIIFDSPPAQMTVGLGLAPDKFKGGRENMATEDRKKVAEFIRAVSKGSGGEGGQSSTPFDSIAEYFTDSTAPAAYTSSDGDGAASTPLM
jgi:Mechanosensitive ion channel